VLDVDGTADNTYLHKWRESQYIYTAGRQRDALMKINASSAMPDADEPAAKNECFAVAGLN
jgi:hypothetical protein